MIGVAITAYNRPEVLKRSVREWKKHLPKGAKLIVVDDGSDTPIPGATCRMPANAGIAAAKNKCIELLMDAGCTHLFLSDCDTFPKNKEWADAYINSGLKHLSFTFHKLANGRVNGRNLLRTKDGISEYGSPCGCMLYIHRDVIDVIGGFDVDYPQWGYEHVDFSNRAHNAGLTPVRYGDVSNSTDLLYSMDYYSEVSGSTGYNIRSLVIVANKERFAANMNSKEYMPYMNPVDGVVLAAYFNANPDPQRGQTWESSAAALQPLIDSCAKVGVPLKIFHDCFDAADDDIFIRVPQQHQYCPNVYRWTVYHEYLKDNPSHNVFMADSTDVQVLRNPFLSINPNRLYVGDEHGMRVDNNWMRRTQEPYLREIKDYRRVIGTHAYHKLPNCGIVGGSYGIVMEYLKYRVEYHERYTHGLLKSTDMAVFNYILWKHFKGRMTSGIKVNTRFKANEYNKISFFKHK